MSRIHFPTLLALLPALLSALLPATLLADTTASATGITRHSTTITVNSASDDSSRCTRDFCTLRGAIERANANLAPTRIRFDHHWLQGPIRLNQPLPALGQHTSIDGSIKGDKSECPLPAVHIDGSNLGRGDVRRKDAHGLVLAGRGNALRGLAITNFPGHGVLITGDDTRITCSFIGVGLDGAEPQGNGGDGIRVQGAAHTVLGGLDPADGLLISANTGTGIGILDSLYTQRNHTALGVNVFGQPKLPNGQSVPAGEPVPESDLPPFLQVRLQRLASRLLTQINDLPNQRLARSDILARYGKLARPDGGAPPEDFITLARLLAQQPELLQAFLLEVDNLLDTARATAARRTGLITQALGRALPGLGRDGLQPAGGNQDTLGQLLAEVNPDDYVLSGPEIEIQAAIVDNNIIVNPLTFQSLTTYGPFSFDTTFAQMQFVTVCQNLALPCFWPIAYDLLPLSMSLIYSSSTLSAQEMMGIVQDNGWSLNLKINGQQQQKGGQISSPGFTIFTDYSVATLPTADCPPGKQCLAVTVYARQALRDIPRPWNVELEVRKLVPIPPEPFIDKFGNIIIVTQGLELFAKPTRTILPNPEFDRPWFTEALYPSFQSERCTQCHAFGNVANLAANHPFVSSTTAGFINSTDLSLQPSLFIPGGEVIGCGINCHYMALSDGNGDPFHEVEWKVPTAALNLDWATMNVNQVCARVKQSLPTRDLRHEHFHEDARLFWAITDATVIGRTTGPKAEPMNWPEFLRRVDLWNQFGAPCP